jgi:hypothetical protein
VGHRRRFDTRTVGDIAPQNAWGKKFFCLVVPVVRDDTAVAVHRNTSFQETGYDATLSWSSVEMGLFAAMLAVGTMCWTRMFATYVHHTMHANQSMVEMLWEWERYDLAW